MKCHESVIEKHKASFKVAAKLLGKTAKIIERLETFELPDMDDDKTYILMSGIFTLTNQSIKVLSPAP